jgi:hypothetical protein
MISIFITCQKLFQFFFVNGQNALQLANLLPINAQYTLIISTNKNIYAAEKCKNLTMPKECKFVASALDNMAGGFAIRKPVMTKTNKAKTLSQ